MTNHRFVRCSKQGLGVKQRRQSNKNLFLIIRQIDKEDQNNENIIFVTYYVKQKYTLKHDVKQALFC